MAGGTHAKTSTGYLETEYVQPWFGIDASLPASQISPGAAISIIGSIIRGGLTNSPALIPVQSAASVTLPNFASGEVPALITNLNGITVIITNIGVWTDYSTASPKAFSQIFTFPNAYSQCVHFGSVVIGNSLYFSSAEQLGVYEIGFAHAVVGLQLISGGSGYTSNPTLTISGGGGSGATGTAAYTPPSPITYPLAIWPNIGDYSFRESLTYTPPTNVVAYSIGGTANQIQVGGTAVVSGCADTSLNGTATVIYTNIGLPFTNYPVGGNFATNLTHSGSYTPFTGMAGGSVAYTGTGTVTSVTLTAGGSGYITAPTVLISGGGGTGASANALLGPVTGMTCVEITAKNGSGPFIGGDFLATVGQRLVLGNIIGGDGNQSLSVALVLINNGGTNYPPSGNVIFTGGGGENAAGTFTASGGVITSITITDPGNGYSSAPTITITAAPGVEFAGTVVMSTAVAASSNTAYPDYFAWSFPSAYGFFDPNITAEAGGYSQLSEARGKISGIAVFESVAIIAHNGGFTEAAVNTSSAIGLNIAPFTFNPLWSADQGVVCRYGSMAQYGALVCFLGEDQTYTLNPNGLTPVADKVASLIQAYSQWTDGRFPNAGLYGSIVEIEGEKHYLVAFTTNDPSLSGAARSSLVYDFNTVNWVATTWTLSGVTLTCPIYQSYDIQNLSGLIVRDNWLLTGSETTVSSAISCTLTQVAVGQQLFTYSSITPTVSPQFFVSFRTETPACGRSQSNRTLWVEYENLPGQSTSTLTANIYGQPDINNQSSATAPIAESFTLPLYYFALSSSVPANAVLSMSGAPTGSAFNTLATSVNLSTSNPIRLIRYDMVGETGQAAQK